MDNVWELKNNTLLTPNQSLVILKTYEFVVVVSDEGILFLNKNNS